MNNLDDILLEAKRNGLEGVSLVEVQKEFLGGLNSYVNTHAHSKMTTYEATSMYLKAKEKGAARARELIRRTVDAQADGYKPETD